MVVTNDRYGAATLPFNAVTGISTLIGNVVLTRGSDVMRGQSAVMDMNNNVSRILPSAGVPGADTARPGCSARNNATGTGQNGTSRSA